MHEHFNAVGNQTGHSVIYRESPWDDASRDRAMEFVRHERSLDSRTGLPLHEAQKDQKFVVTDVTNYATKAIDRRRRQDEAKAKKDKDEHWDDGLTYHVRPATAAELTEAENQALRGGDPVGD